MHEMRQILTITARHLSQPVQSTFAVGGQAAITWQPLRSSATFTTFEDLGRDAQYWRGELPLETDLYEDCVKDYAWASQGPVGYEQVAHILIPRRFTQQIYRYAADLQV